MLTRFQTRVFSLALLAACTVRSSQAQTTDCSSAGIFDECVVDQADIDSGCTSADVNSICNVPGPASDTILCTSPNAGTNLVDCGAVEGTCECVAGVCMTSDQTERCANPQAVGDPHLVGFRGQKFDFTGQDLGVYNVLHDGECSIINMRISALPGRPDITYITGLGMVSCDDNGERHTIEIVVREPQNLEASCPTSDPCLAEGALDVFIDGRELYSPGEVEIAHGLKFAAVNLPGECRPFGFEKYWLAREQEAVTGRRRLREAMAMSNWIIRDPLRTDPAGCESYVRRATANKSLFEHQSEHTSFQVTSPAVSLRLNHGKIHQVALDIPEENVHLPDHLAYQMNIAFHKVVLSDDAQGILGETNRASFNEHGTPIVHQQGTPLAPEEAYRVECLLCSGFDHLRA